MRLTLASTRLRTALPLAVAVLAVACSAGRQPLNSELIRERFGSYGIEVLRDNGVNRRSMLYSVSDGERICRTYALVRYARLSAADAAQVAAETTAIRAGASMGSTFVRAGWAVSKESIDAGWLPPVPAGHPVTDLMQIREATPLAFYAYKFRVKNALHNIVYAEIIEVYHPDFMDLGELRRRYDLPDREVAPSRLEEIETALLHAL